MKIKKVIRTLSQENAAKADILQKRIAQEPLNPKLYLELGELYEQDQLVNESLAEYQKAVALDASNSRALLKTGCAYLLLADVAKATEALQKSLQLNPKSLEAKKALFEAYQQSNNLDDAIAMGEEITKAEPQNIIINKGLLALYKKQNSDDKMGEQIEAMLALAPNDKGVLTEAADYYAGHGEAEKAIRYYSALVKLDPDDTSIKIALGRLYCMSGEYDQCLELLSDKLASMNSTEQYLTRIYLAYSHLKLSHMQKAIEHLLFLESSTNIELDAVDKTMYAQASYEIGKFEHQQGNLERAVRYLTIASRLLPENTSYMQLQDEAQAKLVALQAKARRRVVRNVSVAIIVVALLSSVWFLIHGRIEVEYEGGDNAVLYLDESAVRDVAFVRPGLLVTPKLKMGSYRISMDQEGYERWEGTVSVGLGRTSKVRTKSNRAYGSVAISSDPNNAEIMLDGVHVGKTPVSIDSIVAGRHHVILRKRYFTPANQSISIGSHQKATLRVSLNRARAALVVIGQFLNRTPEIIKFNDEEKKGYDYVNRPIEFEVEAGDVVNVSVFNRYGGVGMWAPIGSFVLEANEKRVINLSNY